jgi:glycerol kinase
MSRYVMALDQGTTSSRAILFDRDGAIAAVDQIEFTQHFPKPGWVEHDAEEIWRTQLRAAQNALAKAGATGADLAAIGITNQRETTVVWDRASGAPIHRAIVWQSRQTAPICEELRARGLADEVRARTGLVIDAYFSGTKVRFILDAVPGARERAQRGELAFGTIDAWLLYRLTKGRVHATEYSNASRTLLYNVHEREWDERLLRELDVPRAILPEVHDSCGVFGAADKEWFGAEVPIAGIAGDQQAALFGQRCDRPGRAKNTYGTGCFLLMNTGETAARSNTGLLTTIAWGIGGRVEYALEGSIFVTGSAVQWLRDQLGIIGSASEIEGLANSVPDNGGIFFVPAFSGLFAPYWRADARGAIVGLSRFNDRGHLARATLEAICYQTRDVLEAMTLDSGVALGVLKVDGGATVNNTLMQLQADILGVSVVRPVVIETTALGAAYAAGLAAGVWPNADQLRTNWKADRHWDPAWSEDRRQSGYAAWKKAIERTLGWIDVNG